MLVTRRRPGESIHIGEGIEVTVLEITPTKVLLGIAAPPDVRIVRSEAVAVARENAAAMALPSRIEAAFARGMGFEDSVQAERGRVDMNFRQDAPANQDVKPESC